MNWSIDRRCNEASDSILQTIFLPYGDLGRDHAIVIVLLERKGLDVKVVEQLSIEVDVGNAAPGVLSLIVRNIQR